MNRYLPIKDSPFEYFNTATERLEALHERIQEMREAGKLSSQVLKRIREFFKIKSIYHSNAIEGNALTICETRLVVDMGMTLAGKSLKDQAEARNLSEALDFTEAIAVSREKPISMHDLRQIHALILKGIEDEFAGKYRVGEVRIAGSEFSPPGAHLLPQQMDDLGKYLTRATLADTSAIDLPILCAAAAHTWFAQIHPFVDGNGRTARILLNLILMRHGYPVCIITRDDRQRYYHALEESQAGDLTSLVELVYENVEESLEEWEKAAQEQQQQKEWLTSVTAKFEQPELKRARNEYEVWRRAMDLFSGYFKQTVDAWNELLSVGSVSLNYMGFGTLDFHKYLSLRDGGSAKKTWNFGIEFKRGQSRARYLFFYGYADRRLSNRARVILYVAKDINHRYERLQDMTQSNKPDIFQVGFDMKEQTFVAWTVGGVQEAKAEVLARQFFEQVIERDFGS